MIRPAIIWLIFLTSSLLGSQISELIPDQLYTGPEPTAPLWEQLSEKGIQTLISVDGIRPDLEKATDQELTYIHLPIGYDGISQERLEQLASALKYAKTPIYLHCHHGKHRGPVAAVVASLANGLISQKSALSYLKEQETSQDYSGLWEAVRTTHTLSHIPKLDLPAHRPVEDLTETMSQLDRVWKNVGLIRNEAWQTPEAHPDLVLNNELTLLYEHLFESQRLQKTANLSTQESTQLKKSYHSALNAIQEFRTLSKSPQPAKQDFEHAFQNTQASCKSCHQQFRD